MKGHPNATAAGVAGALTILLVWVLSLVHVDVPTEVASAITTVGATVVLLIGRRGGKSTPPTPPAAANPPAT
jgi:hypothetical protein